MAFGRYLREPIFAFRAAPDPFIAFSLLVQSARHHLANWAGRGGVPRHPFTTRLALGGSKPDTVTLRAIGGDISILYEVFAEGAYAIPSAAVPADTVHVVVDCGAHIGLSALYFAHRYPRARIIAIEPHPKNFDLLKMNTAAHPNIACVQACVLGRSGSAFISTEGPSWQHHVVQCGGLEIEAVTLSDVRVRFGIDVIDVLKLDVEGAEPEVIRSGIDGIRCIVAEVDGYGLETFARDVSPMIVTTPRGADTAVAWRK
jgi:FkbM family methyltransferase